MTRIRRLFDSSFARFVAGGAITYATTLCVMALWLDVARLPNLVAYATTHVTVLAVGFALNRRWIFRATSTSAATQGLWFFVANALFRGVDWSVYSTLAFFFALPVFLNVLTANVLVLPLKYLFYRHRVFGAGPTGRAGWTASAT